MDPRTINFNVLRRHDPHIAAILDSTSYAVIYRYFHGAWSKTGFEGTLFLFQRHRHPIHGLFVLNRQGLDNLCEGLLAGWDVDLDEGLIIWRSAGATGDADDDVIYGIWVYEEKDRTRIATTMQELIENASAKKDSPQHSPPSSSPPPVSLSHPVPRVPIITAGQTISLDQLFGVGSVCSEPPPQTSALPHPGASVTDPEEEEKENLLPSQVMSPDPSDLPKGMQLLDSLFQKAAVKSHPGPAHQSTNPLKPELLANQHPTSIHQLINQPSGPTSQMPPPNHSSSQSSTNNTRDRRHQSSGPENFKHQPAPIDQSAQPNHHRPMNQQQRNDYRARDNHHNNNPHSRRSSGGSSSHSRNGKLTTMSHNHTTQPHQHTQPLTHHQHPLNPVNIVAAPVPIENANAEARHNILSLLGHPAAACPDDVYSSGAQQHPQNPMLVAPPPVGNQQPVWPNSSPDSRGGSNPRNLYSPQQQHAPQLTGPGSHQAYDSPRSRVASQEASPHQHAQQGVPQHPLPVPSYGNPTDRTPPRGPPQMGSANHSPNGPRPQVDLRHHHHAHQPQPPQPPPPAAAAQPPVGANHLAGGGPQGMSIPNGAPTGPGFTTSVWPFDKLPNRALSPLNPARQSPSNLGLHHRGGRGGGGYPQPHHMNNRKSFQPPRHQPPQQQMQPVDHSPPLVNDSSRPSRSHSYTDATHNSHDDRRASAHSTHHHSPASNSHPAPPPAPIVVNSKLAVESLDQLLAAHTLENGSGSPRHPHQLEDANPLDKGHFVHAILDLINNNGAFVDTLYARYLARYAEKYL